MMAIRLYTEKEIETVTRASEVIIKVFDTLSTYIKEGVTTKNIETVASDIIHSMGGIPASKGYMNYPADICVSVNEELIHGIPSEKKILKNGDIVSVDVVVKYNNYYSDASRTFAVGKITKEVERLNEVTKESFFRALEVAKPGFFVGDIGRAIQTYVEENGFNVVRDYIGHGVGFSIHEDPEVYNYDTNEKTARLKPGMILAVEPMVCMGNYKTKVLGDKWTVVMADKKLCSHYENTILITEGEPKILTCEEKV